MNYWLIKSDPEEYSWPDLVADKTASWDGVRSYAARNHLKAMKKNDEVLVYHSGKESAVVGTAKVNKEYYIDPTSEDDTWVSVEFKAMKPLKKSVPLSEVKADKRLKDMPLVRIARLSVMPVTPEEYKIILERGGT